MFAGVLAEEVARKVAAMQRKNDAALAVQRAATSRKLAEQRRQLEAAFAAERKAAAAAAQQDVISVVERASAEWVEELVSVGSPRSGSRSPTSNSHSSFGSRSRSPSAALRGAAAESKWVYPKLDRRRSLSAGRTTPDHWGTMSPMPTMGEDASYSDDDDSDVL